jgi:uncharacterized protein YbaR (Trm112 family)
LRAATDDELKAAHSKGLDLADPVLVSSDGLLLYPCPNGIPRLVDFEAVRLS